MPSTAIRISGPAHRKLSAMAEEDGVSLVEELDRVIEEQRRQRFLDKLADDYAQLRASEDEWQAFSEEVDAWENTVADGLEDERSGREGNA